MKRLLALIALVAGLSGTIETRSAQAQQQEVTPIPQAPAPRSNCAILRLRASNTPMAQQCPLSNTLTGFRAGDTLLNYYGYATLTVDTNQASVDQNRRTIGDFFAGIFQDEQFTAVISVSMELESQFNGRVPLGDRPLMVVQRKRVNGRYESEVQLITMENAPVTPWFALDNGAPALNLQFTAVRSNDTQISVSDVVEGLTALAPVAGWHGWLLTAISEPVVLQSLGSAENYLSNYFSSKTTVRATSRLDFSRNVGGRPGLTSVSFETAWGSGNANYQFKATVSLAVRPSLITDQMLNSTGRIDWTGAAIPTPSTWADQIFVAPNRSLASVLRERGVPRQLTEFTNGGTDQRTPAQVLTRVCEDLEASLGGAGGYFRLNQIDSDVLVFDQLRSNQVFARQDANQIGCIINRAGTWESRYSLRWFNGGAPPVQITDGHMLRRRTHLRDSWFESGESARRSGLRVSLVNPVSVRLDRQLFNDPVFDALTGEGLGVGTINYATLAKVQMTCFDNWRPVRGVNNIGQGYARFANSSGVYVVALEFDNTRPFDPDEGPKVRSIEVRQASDEDLRTRENACPT